MHNYETENVKQANPETPISQKAQIRRCNTYFSFFGLRAKDPFVVPFVAKCMNMISYNKEWDNKMENFWINTVSDFELSGIFFLFSRHIVEPKFNSSFDGKVSETEKKK